jgi:ABC-2 type transport system permease protein
MRTIALLAINTLKIIARRKASILVYVALPVMGVVLALGINATGGDPTVRVGVVDLDRGRFSQALVSGMGAWGRFAVEQLDAEDMDRRVVDGSLDCGLTIPAGYGESVMDGAARNVVLVSTKGTAVTAWLERYVDLYTAGLRDMAVAASGDLELFERMLSSQKMDGPRLQVESLPDLSTGRRIVVTNLGYLIMFLMLGASLTTQLILGEKRSRTYYRVCSAPVRPRQYVLGNGIAALAIIAAQILLIQIVLKLVVRVETYVPDHLLFLVLLLFGLVSVALGMAITAFSRSATMASAITTLILSPTCMLAGCFWPIDFMPPFLQRLALFLPQRWALNAVEALQTGGGIRAIAIHLLVIAAFAVTLGLVASYRFARTEESGQFV